MIGGADGGVSDGILKLELNRSASSHVWLCAVVAMGVIQSNLTSALPRKRNVTRGVWHPPSRLRPVPSVRVESALHCCRAVETGPEL
jgi:hypothetical protein